MLQKNNLILKVTNRLLAPYIGLYGLYIQLNGEISPGGGFQAGVILACSYIALDIIGLRKTSAIEPTHLLHASVIGVFLYLGTGMVCILSGANFLNYNALSANPLSGQHLGIFLVESGIGLNVAAIMILIYQQFNKK